MCNDYAREIEVGRVIKLTKELDDMPPLQWRGGRIPNDAGPTPHIKIREKGVIARLDGGKLAAEMMTWAWKAPTGKPVFNFVSEKRDFSTSNRCLILATGFYEYTTPEKPKVKLKDQHFFQLKGVEWFWIAGIVKQDCFTMLTVNPGPDIRPYHDRQICVLPPAEGMHWLKLDKPEAGLLRQLPRGTLQVQTLRRNGELLNG